MSKLYRPDTPEMKERIEKLERRHRRTEHLFLWALHIIERFIAAITMLALTVALLIEIYVMFTEPGYCADVSHLLHHLLTIVVGLEFVRMLIDTTPANILEVLTVAITRHVVLSHDSAWSILAYVICIGGLFAIRRFLIRRSELTEEMVEME